MPDFVFYGGSLVPLVAVAVVFTVAFVAELWRTWRSCKDAQEELRAGVSPAPRAPVFDIDVEDDWAGFA